MPQQRSSTAVWIALALIAGSITCVALGFNEVKAAQTPKGLSTGAYILFFASLIGSLYFIVRLGFAGLMIIFGKPINRTVAWVSAFGALLHCGIVLAVVIAAIVVAPPQGFPLVAAGIGIALVALFVMGQYPNLAETQGWEVAGEPTITTAPSKPTTSKPTTSKPTPSKPTPRPSAPSAPVKPVAAAPVIIAPLPPAVSTDAPRAAGSSDDRGPSLLR